MRTWIFSYFSSATFMYSYLQPSMWSREGKVCPTSYRHEGCEATFLIGSQILKPLSGIPNSDFLVCGNWRQETVTENLFEYCENLFATLDRRTYISKHKLPDVLSWRKISTGLPHRFPGFLLLFSHLQPFVLVFNPIYHTPSTDPVTIKTMLESSDILKLLIIDTRVKLANLLIGGKSFTEIVFVSFLSQGTRTNATSRY
jgi:hypothetical protein